MAMLYLRSLSPDLDQGAGIQAIKWIPALAGMTGGIGELVEDEELGIGCMMLTAIQVNK